METQARRLLEQYLSEKDCIRPFEPGYFRCSSHGKYSKTCLGWSPI